MKCEALSPLIDLTILMTLAVSSGSPLEKDLSLNDSVGWRAAFRCGRFSLWPLFAAERCVAVGHGLRASLQSCARNAVWEVATAEHVSVFRRSGAPRGASQNPLSKATHAEN